jgi:hypothetical protein
MKLKRIVFATTAAALLAVSGCKTPPEVKSALASLDDGYAANARLMAQYKQLGDSFREREIKWNLYINNRQKLDLALLWATRDAESAKAPQGEYVDEAHAQLGDELVGLVNQFRLNGLKPQNGKSGQTVFQPGTNTMDALIGAIPAFAHAAATKSAAEQPSSKNPSGAFDDYAARVAALRRINQAISTYLNIDETVRPEDVHDIATSVRSLSGH